MSHQSACRRHGTIARASGAAAAALKARASAWEAPVTEAPGRISLFLWGCELRLSADTDSARIDLSAPEPRLLGTLQDSATQIFAEAGLSVAWDHVDEGALAPGLSLMRLADRRPRGTSFLRIRLAGADACRFARDGLHVRLLLPQPGRAPVWPRIAASGRTAWPEGADALHRPVYTVAAQGDGWLDFDLFRHAGSPTCDWACSAPLGAQVGVIGPGGGWCPQAPALSLFGDQTALPAIRRMLDLAPGLVAGPVRAWISAEASDLGDHGNDARIRLCDDPLAALKAADLPRHGHVWFAGHADAARAARAHLSAQGLPKRDFMAAAYWG